jgi:F-type H+-transporting ATPase subunit gamma
MEMVATARFKKAHDRVLANRPFVHRLMLALADVIDRGEADPSANPLLKPQQDVKRDVLLVITSNRGLAGPFNSGVLRVARERYRQVREAGYEIELLVAGKRGISAMKFAGLKMARTFTEFDAVPPYDTVRQMADEIMEQYVAGKISGLEVAYTQFVSSGKQQPVIAQVLPLSELRPQQGPKTTPSTAVFEMLPSADELLHKLLPLTVRMKLYQCFLESSASEQVMRIAAMRAATENASELIHSLTVRYNRQRQAQITTELAEIMGGRGAVE